ncbi:hypothetical protein B566_EDAN011622 [Ephemera danica]|nr:hypothetical protein B566_EDAN011622 [Ephemera danica]
MNKSDVPDSRGYPDKSTGRSRLIITRRIVLIVGPDDWSKSFATCAGKYQSPIDIDLHEVMTVQLPPIKYHGFNKKPLSTVLSNNGHTVMLQLNMSEPLAISGGPLRGKYVFQQLHWHWGYNDSVGSEDTINHQSFPMELHMVFYRSIYGGFTRALEYKDGLAVLAFFYEVIGRGSAGNNNAYAEMVEHLPSVALPHSEARLVRQQPMDHMLPKDRSQYFTYNGSLTTPPCSEVVIWIDYKHPIRLSHDQIDEFRRLQTSGGAFMTHNNRPTQPLGDRVVLFNDVDLDQDDDSASLQGLSAPLLLVSLLLAARLGLS